MKDFLSQHRVDKVYSYSEVREGNTVYFGWIDGGELNDEYIVISSPSTTKASDEDKQWSSSEGITASNLSHYRKWFEVLTQSSVDDFLTIWSKNKSGLELFQKNKNKSYREGEGEFLIKLAELIKNHKKFSLFGRTYKVILPT